MQHQANTVEHVSSIASARFAGMGALLARDGRVPDTKRESANMFGATGPLATSIAETDDQFEAARDLVQRRYAWRGYGIDQESGCNDVSETPPRREITFVTTNGVKTLGTLTLGLDGPGGLLAEGTHAGVIDTYRTQERTVCEFIRLAIEESVDSKRVLAGLFSAAHAVAWSHHDVTDAFIEVNPRHARFYARSLGFSIAAGKQLCERVGAPSVLLRLELEELVEKLEFPNPMPPEATVQPE